MAASQQQEPLLCPETKYCAPLQKSEQTFTDIGIKNTVTKVTKLCPISKKVGWNSDKIKMQWFVNHLNQKFIVN